MSKNQTALEAIVAQHTKDIDGIGMTMKEVVNVITGLRKDMADRSETMIKMLTDQNAALIKSQTDHELKDTTRFAEIKTRMAYYAGGGAAIYAIVAITVGALDLYLRH